WPMMNRQEESDTRADRALAMTRLLTLVRFSVSLERPPKNSKVNLLRMTAWSPPRDRAISMDRLAYWSSSWKESPSTPMPMEKVADRPLGLTTWWMVSRMSNF